MAYDRTAAHHGLNAPSHDLNLALHDLTAARDHLACTNLAAELALTVPSSHGTDNVS